MLFRLSFSVVADWSWPIWLICARSWSFFAGSIGSWFWSWVIIILMKSSGFSDDFLEASWCDDAVPWTGGVYMPVVSARAGTTVQKSNAVISRAAGVARPRRESGASGLGSTQPPFAVRASARIFLPTKNTG